MSCQEARGWLDAYVDGELDLIRSLEFEHHLEGCIDCQKLRDQYRELRRSLRTRNLYFHAPKGLDEKIRRKLGGTREQESQGVTPKAFSLGWRLSVVAAILIALVVFGTVFVEMLRRPSHSEMLAELVVSSHIRSLMANHLTDVLSTDQHTVKPWFNGRLDFAPVVKDLAPEGFPLIGGRLDYLDGRPVAALVYKRQQHIINLFIWPSPQSDSGHQTSVVRGYNIVRWTQAHMEYWAISDLNTRELVDFVGDEQR
jgi:anti-sigma factor RsiW